MEGAQEQDDWQSLLVAIAEKIQLTPRIVKNLPRSHLARWESLLRHWAYHRKIEPFEAERELQKFTCERLRQHEKVASKWELYGCFVNAHFNDIITLNFDRSIALSTKKPKFVTAPKGCPGGAQGEPMFRHHVVRSPSDTQTLVWHPHGDTKKYASLKLGVRRYGFYVAALEELRLGLGEKWRFKRPWHQPKSYDSQEASTHMQASWASRFLNRNLMFIGCGLSLDEWPLWWMIRQRFLLHHLRKSRRPQAVYLYVDGAGESKDVLDALCRHGIEPLAFQGFSQMWELLLKSFR